MKHLKRRAGSPNFLFSTWPQVEWSDPPRVVVEHSGGVVDHAQMQVAVNRLAAIGGGIVRVSAGNANAETIVIPENLFLERSK